MANPTIKQWFNTSAFNRQAAGTFGNGGRNTIQGPSTSNVDAALWRIFKITESTKIDVRAEAFNLFNHARFNNPGTSLVTGTRWGKSRPLKTHESAFGGTSFMFTDQHPVFKAPYSRDKVHVIMRLDPDSLSPADRARRADGDFAVVWAKQYGKGRVLNIGWGHPDETWDDPRFQKMVLEGIKWALGMTPADVTPKPFPRK